MQLTNKLFIICTLIYYSLAFTAKNAEIAYSKSEKTAQLGDIDSNFIKSNEPFTIDNIDESINFKFQLENKKVPDQVSLLFGIPTEDLEVSFTSQIDTSSKKPTVSFTIEIAELPESLLHFASNENHILTGSLIIASENGKQENIYVPVFDVELDIPINDKFVNPERYEAQKEIFHQFPNPPKTVSAFLAQLFSCGIIAIVVALFLTWAKAGALSFDNFPTGKNAGLFLGFILAVVGFEIIFVLYYRGLSIFTTLEYSFILGTFGLLVGTAFLRSFGKSI